MTHEQFLTFAQDPRVPSAKDEHEAFQYYQEHSTTGSRNLLVLKYQKLVYSQAKKYHYISAQDREDMFQEGLIGLTTAVERFDPDYGTKFSTFAFPYIQKGFYNYLQENGTAIRIPQYLIHDLNTLRKAQNQYQEHHPDHFLGEKELAELTGVSSERIKRLAPYIYPSSLSLDSSANDTHSNHVDSENKVEEWLPHDLNDTYDAMLENYVPEEVNLMMNRVLGKKVSLVLQYHFGFTPDGQLNRAEIAQKMRISPSRVDYYYKKGISRLRNTSQGQKILSFLQS